MKKKVLEFIFSFTLYCTIFLIRSGWPLTGKQVAEMVFLGTLMGLFLALTLEPMTRFIGKVVRTICLRK